MKDELGGKIMTKFVVLTYSYLTYDNANIMTKAPNNM